MALYAVTQANYEALLKRADETAAMIGAYQHRSDDPYMAKKLKSWARLERQDRKAAERLRVALEAKP